MLVCIYNYDSTISVPLHNAVPVLSQFYVLHTLSVITQFDTLACNISLQLYTDILTLTGIPNIVQYKVELSYNR